MKSTTSKLWKASVLVTVKAAEFALTGTSIYYETQWVVADDITSAMKLIIDGEVTSIKIVREVTIADLQ